LDFSFLRKYYGGWWLGCAEFEVFLECGAFGGYEAVLTIAFATCFISPLFWAFRISMPMILPFSSSSRCMSGSASMISWLGPSLKSM